VIRHVLFILLMVPAIAWGDDLVLFAESFRSNLQEGWSWLREDDSGWRITDQGLEIRVQPGNMWGGANDAKNVLVRPVGELNSGAAEVTVVVENRPTEQYEQIDLVWYYADSHMVKIGQELVDGQLSIVMGREENDRTRTLAIIPLEHHRVELRLRVEADQIEGAFRPFGSPQWTTAGRCQLPTKDAAAAQISLQAYQGPADKEHWARVQDLQVRLRRP
jgi:regulation of enolase protein 1 (concanavalin A-like superfamily)